MFFLILSIVSSVTIGNLLKLFQKDKEFSILSTLLSNYFIATCISTIQSNFFIITVNFIDIILAVIVGVLYFINFLIYNENVKENGISLSISIMRVSLIIPLFLSIFLFKERLTINLLLGTLFIILALLMIGKLKNKINIFLLFLLFFNTGISESGLKFFDVYGKNDNSFFLSILFLSAFIANFIFFLIVKEKISFKNILYGFIIGIPNQFMSFFFLKSLKCIPASIAYPFLGGGVVLGGIFSDIIFWRMRPPFKQYVIFILLLFGVVFLNSKP
ncbi:MAG: hypothetical protein WHT27_01725 [candidate division WOR-3 bacterium]|jgi:drug/metabolite transporter (DMT)-like permease